ncbi:MAG: 4Fe-4S binding protein [candidate division WS1 bacterium]|jgi:pyruvate formate lyase activating enzyme|nr:4Fe-4S binding protein [candidate division WS1 bacterium]
MRHYYLITSRCTFCGQCLVECPAEAITMDRTGAHIDQARCRGCGVCYDNCASEAIDRLTQPPEKDPDGRPNS